MNKVYYAHPVSIYNTKQEERDILLLKKLDFEISNPNELKHQKGYQKEGMNYFNSVIENCNFLCFRSFPNGDIPAGIAKEIEYAKSLNKIIFELPSGILKRILSIEQTREYLTENGNR